MDATEPDSVAMLLLPIDTLSGSATESTSGHPSPGIGLPEKGLVSMFWSQVLLDGLAAGLLGGIVAAGVAVYVSSREGRARYEERRLAVATRILDSVDALASAVSRDDEKSIFDSRLALLRWTRIEGLYGGHRCHKDYVAWLRAHLVRIAILVPAQPAGLVDFSYDDRETTRNVLLAIEEATIRWMSMKPGEWSPGDWGTDRGLDEARAKVDRTSRYLPGSKNNDFDSDELDLSGVPEVGATEVGSDKSPADARSRVKPRKFRLPTLRWNKQAARPNRQGTDDAGGLQIPTEHDKDHGGISRDDQGG